MDLNRRSFILAPAAMLATDLLAAEPAVPWQRKIRRLGQTNMTEHDPPCSTSSNGRTTGPA